MLIAAIAAGTVADGAAAQTSGGALRDPLRFGASIGLDETYSDNINLAGPGQERSDFVTTISPSFSISRVSGRLSLGLDYTPQLLFYARGSNGTQVRNNFDATARATIVENQLFFDANSTIGQSNISPFGTLAANSVNGSSNRVETRSYSVGPTLQSRVGQDLTYSAGLRYSVSGTDSNALATSHATQVFARFASGTSFRDLGYGADVSRDEQDYGGLNKLLTETAGVTLTYVVSPTIHLHGRIGYDRSSYPTTGQPDLKSVAYSGGVDWQPSHHTQFTADAGHRYFGPTANVSLRETTSKVALSASYTQDQTTSANNGVGLALDPNYALLDQYYRTTVTDPVLRAQAITAALSQAGLSTSQYAASSFYSNQLFVQKNAQISLALLGRFDTVTLTASRADSRSLSSINTGFDVFDQSGRFRTTSLTANWSHRLGQRTSINATAQKSHNQSVDGVGDTRQRQLTASINRQLGKSLTGTLLYRNTRQDGVGNSGVNSGVNTGFNNNFNNGVNTASNSNFYSGAYRENAVLGSLRLTF